MRIGLVGHLGEDVEFKLRGLRAAGPYLWIGERTFNGHNPTALTRAPRMAAATAQKLVARIEVPSIRHGLGSAFSRRQ